MSTFEQTCFVVTLTGLIAASLALVCDPGITG